MRVYGWGALSSRTIAVNPAARRRQLSAPFDAVKADASTEPAGREASRARLARARGEQAGVRRGTGGPAAAAGGGVEDPRSPPDEEPQPGRATARTRAVKARTRAR